MRNNKQILKIFKRKAIAFILIFFAIFTSRLKAQGVDVIFYLDNSGSIDATEWANMSNSTKALIDDVLECNVNNRVAVVHFTGIDRDPQISTDPRIYIESNFTNNATAAKNFLKRGSSIGTHMPAMGNRTFTYENTVLLNYALGSGAPSSQIVSSQKNLTRNPNNQLVIFTFTDSPRGYHESAGAVNGNGFVRYFGSGGEFDIYNQMKSNLKANFVILHAPTNDPTEDILARRAGATVASVGGSYTGSLYANPGDPQGSGVKPRKAVMSDDFDISSINIETIAENICKSCAPTVTINAVTPPTQSICLNGTAQPLVSDAVGTGTLSYQWYRNTTNSNTGGTPISGAVSNTYQPSTSIAGTSYYYVVVSDSYCEGISYSPVVSVTIDDQGMCRPCPGPDSDGDGIPDYCDLDDDNDGILDTNEGVVDNDNVLEWGYNGTGDTPSIFNSTVISAAQNVTKGSGLTSQIFGIETSYSVSGVGATTISQAINNNSYFQFKFTTANFPNTMQYLYDRFSLYVRPPSEYPTYKMRLYISTDNFATSTDISSEVAYPIVPYEDRVVFPLTSPYNLAPNKSYTLRLYFYDVLGGSSATFNHDDFRVLSTEYADTDGDGIPNHLDLDSDNDGCLDALEGDENVTVAQLVNASGTVTVGLGSTANNQNLGVTVNANGVPTIVNSAGAADIGSDVGQGIGFSQNASVNDCVIVNQCVSGDCNNNTFLNTSDPNTIEYDNFISGFHSSIIKKTDGSYMVWGQNARPDGVIIGSYANLYEPTLITPANGFNYTGKVLKATMGTRGSTGISSSDQYALLTEDGLYIWGGGATGTVNGTLVSNTIKSDNLFARVSNSTIGSANSYGLPAGINPYDVKMMFGSYGTLAITTCKGEAYVLSWIGNKNGDGSNDTTVADRSSWHKVMKDDGTPLNKVVAMRGTVGALIALTQSGELYTWGTETYLGDGSNKTSRLYAAKMTLPTGVTPKMIGMTKASGTTNVNLVSYYLLSTTGEVYSLGDNSKRQLGTFDTVEQKNWVNVRSTNATTNMNNIVWISPNEHDNAGHAVVQTLTADGKLWGWGMNNVNMLGTGTNIAVDPRNMFGGLNTMDKILAVETGGHINALFKDCDYKMGYIGHDSNGSYGQTSSNTGTNYSTFQFTGQKFSDLCAITLPPYAQAKDLKICPGITVNLGDALLGTVPLGYEVQWWTTPTRNVGTQVSNPTMVGPGSYYVFYISSTANMCTNVTGTAVTVSYFTSSDTEYTNCFCYKPAATVGTITETKHGITSLGRAGAENGNWPMVRNNAWTVLESKTKGFVINRISTTAAIVALPNPVEGMMVYDEQADCLKINTDGTSGGWKCFNTQTCP